MLFDILPLLIAFTSRDKLMLTRSDKYGDAEAEYREVNLACTSYNLLLIGYLPNIIPSMYLKSGFCDCS